MKNAGTCIANFKQGLSKECTVNFTVSMLTSYGLNLLRREQRAYKERVANLVPVADWLSRSWPKIGPVEAKM